jgi:hypothetical protein
MDIPEKNSLFKRLGLTKSITVELSMTTEEFKESFKSRVGSEVGFFGHSNHNREFHGDIKRTNFKVRRSNTFFNNRDSSMAVGSYLNENGKVVVQVMAHAPMAWIVISSLIILLISTLPIVITAKSSPESLMPAIIIGMATLFVFPLFLFSL